MCDTREQIAAAPLDVLRALPGIGRLMIAAKNLGVTHERIGTIEACDIEGDWVSFGGAEHDSRIEHSAIAAIVADRSSMMKDKAFPRLELLRGDGSEVCHIVGFEGLGPFDAVLAGFATSPLPPREPEAGPERRETGEEDAAVLHFEALRLAGQRVGISLRKAGFRQSWTGVIEAVQPAMGFINVMRPDFHLHIRAGAIAAWVETGTVAAARTATGEDTGLSIATLT